MASPLSSLSLVSSALLFLLLSSYGGQTLGGDHHLQVLRVDRLMPAAVCSSKAQGPNSLRVVHRRGPCSPDAGSKHDPLRTLARDSLRVASLQAIFSSAPGGNETLTTPSGVSLPAQRGTSLGTGNYVVTLGFGTPKTDQTVIFDTGSNVCWIQCKPCSVSCYPQKQPLFDPSNSSSYSKISCTSTTCESLSNGGCSSGTCTYSVHYGDKSTTAGTLSAEKLTLTAANVFPGFVFGCGQNNTGLFEGIAGLVGLGRSPYSLVSQTASKLGNVFSYCLPRTSSTTGHLSLGKSSASTAEYTPMLTDSRSPSLYFIDLIGISVGGTRLPVSATVFRSLGTIIDSGTVITRLPMSAYAALRSAFRSAMARYARVSSPTSLLDTCYDFSKATTVTYPIITLHYTDVDVKLGSAGTFYIFSISQFCLAFAGNADSIGVGIVGNIQQSTFEVIFDIGAKKIGFAAGTCG